jgi:hypothetical protein
VRAKSVEAGEPAPETAIDLDETIRTSAHRATTENLDFMSATP